MRRAILFAAAIVCALLIASDGHAQSLLEFDRWMQVAEKRNLSMHRNLKRKDDLAAVDDAREIQAIYKLMEAFFSRRGDATDAVKLSRDGAKLAADVMRSAAARDFDAARRAAIALATACRDCHSSYKPLE